MVLFLGNGIRDFEKSINSKSKQYFTNIASIFEVN